MTNTALLPRVRAARWAVVAAWPPELEPLVATLPPRLREQVLFATVGVGLIEAAMGTAKLIAEHSPEAILLVGTAGVYPGQSRQLRLGSAAVIDEMVLLATLHPGTSGYLPEIVPTRARSSSALLRALRKTSKLPSADTACPLAITASSEAAVAAAHLTGCALENLEAFAVARAAASAGIPFAAVLGVANHVGPTGHLEWKQNGRRAAAAACDTVLSMLRVPPAAPPSARSRRRRL